MPPSDVSELLAQWENTYKKGLLTFWILLLLDQRQMYAYEMPTAIAEFSNQTVTADENSVYRALRRFHNAGLVRSELRPSDAGPPRRYFELSSKGRALLAEFIRRNVLVFQSQPVSGAINQVILTAMGKDG